MNGRKAHQVAAKCARIIMKELGRELATNGKPIKEAVLSALRRKLPPYGGRPRNRELDQAEKLRAEGWGMARIAAALRPNYWSLPKPEQRALVEWLRRGLQQRRTRKRREGLTTPTNAADVERPAESDEPEANIGHEAPNA